MDSYENVEVEGPGLQLPDTVIPSIAEGGKAPEGGRAGPGPEPVPARRYDERRLLGEGGMGEVHLCRDRVVGRDVAMKLIRSPVSGSDEATWRFLREARVQGQLEHPAVVPVYDLGADASGRMYFTMKRIRGASLADVLAGLAAGDPEAQKRWTLRRLLAFFAQVCNTLEYAHSRGVVHRDLKPANLMLGDFGEVYVLDWGLARIGGGSADPAELGSGMIDVELLVNGEATRTGAMLGTPAYMAPEQLREGHGSVDARTDVYALGLVLFEILALERVQSELPLVERLLRTLSDDGLSPTAAAPHRDIPPELDRLCFAATRLRQDDRVPSARELGERVEAYLDGDRDAALRASMAQQHAESARAALARSIEPDADEALERTTAMREVTLALGLAPEHEDARRTLVTLLATPPRAIPAEAQERVRRRFEGQRRTLFWGALVNYLLIALWAPFPIWMGVRSWTGYGAIAAACTSCALITGYYIWRGHDRSERLPLPHLAVTATTLMCTSVFFGPMFYVPMFAMGNVLMYLAVYSHRRWIVIAASVLSLALPVAGTALGWLPDFYSEGPDGSLVIHPVVMSYPYLPTMAFLLITQIAFVAIAGVLQWRVRDSYEEAIRAVELQSWQLEQILPGSAQPSTERPAA